MASQAQPLSHYPMDTSGYTQPVWVHKAPWSDKPRFSKLTQDLETDVCVIGAGISGISAAYELIKRGKKVVMIEAREVVSGESGRTSGHLCNFVDDPYTEIEKKHSKKVAQAVADSHTWALHEVGRISKELGIECEYRLLPDYEISQYERGTKEHDEEVADLKEQVKKVNQLGIEAEFKEGFAIRGWDGKVDQRDAAVVYNNATFHPTQYMFGVLEWLKKQPNFQCFTNTRMKTVDETGFFTKEVKVETLDGNTITCKDAIESTHVPLQKLSIIVQLEYFRTYCIAVRIPKDSYEDCLINDQGDVYNYIRFTKCDEKDDYLVIGGADHKAGQYDGDERDNYDVLEKWVRERFPQTGSVDYKWSGQILNSGDFIQFIGKNQGKSHIYVISGDTGHGLTMGVFGGRLLAEEITEQWTEQGRAWSDVYNPKRFPPLTVLPDIIANDLQINAQFKRYAQSDIEDIGDLKPGTGGVLNTGGSRPLAVYKDDDGKTFQYSAICPHLKGVVCWNQAERSFDCPIHASRFSKEGICIEGPSKAGLQPMDNPGAMAQEGKPGVMT